jgi:hypothetical protein
MFFGLGHVVFHLFLWLLVVAHASLSNKPIVSFSLMESKLAELDRETMPSLFGPEEAQYDRYAACLAATEGLRRIRDKKLGSRRFFIHDTEEMSEAQRRIKTEYILHSSKVLEAMGMLVKCWLINSIKGVIKLDQIPNSKIK